MPPEECGLTFVAVKVVTERFSMELVEAEVESYREE
jgi:hypothetical protein